jgi:hypothetical protein
LTADPTMIDPVWAKLLDLQNRISQFVNGNPVSQLTADAAPCTSASQTPTGLSVGVFPGLWMIEASLGVVVQSTALQSYLSAGGTAGASSMCLVLAWSRYFNATTGYPDNFTVQQTAWGSNATMASGAWASTGFANPRMYGWAQISGTGTLAIAQAASGSGSAFTVKNGSLLKCRLIA